MVVPTEFPKGKGKKSIHFNGSEENVEIILRTVISFNRFNISFAVADLCKEFDPESINHFESELCESLVIPTQIANANAITQTDLSVQVNLLQEYFKKFVELLDDQKLSELCFSGAGFLQEIGKGQFFITLEEEGPEVVQTVCRKYVNSTPTNAARTELHSMTTFHHAKTRSSRAERLRIAHLCVLKQLSSTCHVSFLAALDTDHKHKFSLTFLTYLSDSLTNTHKIFGTWSIFTLRSSTAEWRINRNPISHRNTLNLETSQHPDREGGLVQIRKSAQSWMCNFILTMDEIALLSWSKDCSETKQFLGFVLWMVSINTSQ